MKPASTSRASFASDALTCPSFCARVFSDIPASIAAGRALPSSGRPASVRDVRGVNSGLAWDSAARGGRPVIQAVETSAAIPSGPWPAHVPAGSLRGERRVKGKIAKAVSHARESSG
ncbi:hypothetical protein GCM10012319_48800 [Comamonas sp. KCTC 72670]|nr:hypothetical protein GCM10012319_48800 [Comamonas sp. KCTC 72670]